jgi:ribonucleoside-diphosphate reductase alpha chain
MADRAVQQHMPKRRSGHTTAVTIGAERFYLTANARDDGSLGEAFIQWGKQGTTGAGLMDIYAAALSIGLQHRVPLVELVRQGLNLHFVPNGHTDDPQIPRVRSVIDYIARRMAIDWLPYEKRAELGIFTVDERVDQARAWMAPRTPKCCRYSRALGGDAGLDAFRWDLATGIGAPAHIGG